MLTRMRLKDFKAWRDLRQESEDWLGSRAKLVHPDFIQSVGERWHSRSLRWNILDPGRVAAP